MITKMRPRYYCEHCKKGSGSPSAMRRHERGCTLNPQRECGMCRARAEYEEVPPTPPTSALLSVLKGGGFAALRARVSDCPACILATLRVAPDVPFDDYDKPDNRERLAWRFEEAKERWWAKVNELADKQERERYY